MAERKVFRFFLIWAIVIAFVISIIFSIKAFTGNVIGGEINSRTNAVSLGFFLTGLLGSLVFLSRFRKV